jgi:hypothetical protein
MKKMCVIYVLLPVLMLWFSTGTLDAGVSDNWSAGNAYLSGSVLYVSDNDEIRHFPFVGINLDFRLNKSLVLSPEYEVCIPWYMIQTCSLMLNHKNGSLFAGAGLSGFLSFGDGFGLYPLLKFNAGVNSGKLKLTAYTYNSFDGALKIFTTMGVSLAIKF